ncbi:hypothetical protein FQZ97_1087940 [compost metagenome]
MNPATPAALPATALTLMSGRKPSVFGAGFIRTIGRKAAMLTTSAMIIPMTEAFARLAAAAGITGLSGWAAGSGEAAEEPCPAARLSGADLSCVSLTLL